MIACSRAVIMSELPQDFRKIECVIETPLGPSRFASVHIDHIGPETRLPQIEAARTLLLDGPRECASWGGPFDDGWFEHPAPPMPASVILMGDFNFTWDSAEYDAFLGRRSSFHGRAIAEGGFCVAWVAAGHGEDEGASINTPRRARRIDRCFVTVIRNSAIRIAVTTRKVSRDRRW